MVNYFFAPIQTQQAMPDIRQAPPVSRLYTANYPPLLLAEGIIRRLYIEYGRVIGYTSS